MSGLEDALERFDERKQEKHEEAAKERQEDERFLEECEPLLTDLVRPVAREISEKLEEHGHDCEVKGPEEEGRLQRSVEVRVTPRTDHYARGTSLTFRCHHRKTKSHPSRQLRVSGKVSDSSREDTYEIDRGADPSDVTEDWVREGIVEFVEELLKRR